MRFYDIQLLPFFALLFVAVCPAEADEFTLESLGEISGVSSPQISPDGDSVVIVVSRPDYEANEFKNRLVLVSVASGQTRDLTADRSAARRPRWSPDGDHLAFIAQAAEGKSQVFALPISGGEARMITSSPTSVASFEWSPNGKEVLYVAAGEAEAESKGQEHHNRSFKVTHHGYLATQAPPSLDVWRVPVIGGDAVRINRDDVHVLGGQFSSFRVAPDGSAVVFTGFPADHPGDFTESQLFVLDIETGKQRPFGGSLRKVFWGAISPDGRNLAYSHAEDENNSLYRTRHIAVGGFGTEGARTISQGIDRSFWRGSWMPDSKGMLIGASDGSRSSLWYQPLTGNATKLELGNLEPLLTFGPVDLDVGNGGEIAFIATTSQRPTELYWLDAIDGQPRQLTDFNAGVAAMKLGSSEPIVWETRDGFQANGILTYPPDFKPGEQYPLVLAIHGGPMMSSTLGFSDRHQLLAASGFIVFAPNYRGSDNLGAKYQAAIVGDAGSGPGRDVMAGLEAVKALGIIDKTRIGVTGWSYGGYMTSWLIGNYPDVWRAAMAGAAVTDYLSLYTLTSENNLYGDAFSELPWSPEGQAVWREQSPITHIYRATTPTLIMSNTGDARVPVTNSYQLYHALNDNKVPVEFIAYPIPGHFPGDPVHQRDVLRRWVGWMEQRFELPRDAPVPD